MASGGQAMARRSALGGIAALITAVTLAVAPAFARSQARAEETPAGLGFGFGIESVLDGYDRPVFVTNDGRAKRLFIVEQTGRIKVATRETVDDPWQKAGVFLNLSALVHDPGDPGNNERGLLGLAFHPDYFENHLFYVFYTRESDDKNVLVEYERQSKLKADPTSARLVFGIPHGGSGNHNGGEIHFGPDGYLYLSTGDSGASAQPARDLDSRHGKILRLDPTDPVGPDRYTIPPDNPYVGVDGHDLVWSFGLRNPWRISHDVATGDLWIGDVGSQAWEEVDHDAGPNAGKGDDYGWHLCEGDHPRTGTEDDCGAAPNTTVRPVAEFASGGDPRCAVTGGYVYRGADQPSLQGNYFFADYCQGDIWKIPTDFDLADGDTLPSPLATDLLVSSFGLDSRDELYVVDLGGSINLLVET